MNKILVSIIGAFLLILCVPLISRAYISKPDLTVVGYIDMSQGLGRQSKELVDTFSKEMKVNFIETKKKKPKKFQTFLSLFKKDKNKWGKVIIFEDMLWAPELEKYKTLLNADPQSVRIAYTMWESSKLLDEWVMILNEHFDAAVVPAPFLVDVYINSGVTIPVFHLPLGLNLEPFLNQPLKEKAGTPFVFGNLSVCSERKNHLTLIHAFAKAFGNDPNVQLRLNCRLGEKKVSKALTQAITDLGLDNIIFTQFKLSSERYLETFKSIDCYVSPSKGEGFSIQPREAMALGIPTIVTNTTGQAPICESSLVKVVDAPFQEPAQFPWGNIYGHYYACDCDDLAQALIDVKEHYDVHLSNALKLREWASQYLYTRLKPYYRTLIKPKRVVLGDENRIEPDQIITNSPKLARKYQILLNRY